jgi:putative oxidoreductase
MPVNIAFLILRLVVGLVFIGHGTQKLFGWFGGGGPQGTGGFFEKLGYRPGVPMAVIGGLSEAGGGVLIASGFLTPLGSAAIIGMMTSATLSVHLPKGFWNTNGGYEFPLTLATIGAALAFAGPSSYSLDSLIGWKLWGISYGVGAILLGVVGALALNALRLRTLRQPVPEQAPNGETKPRAA